MPIDVVSLFVGSGTIPAPELEPGQAPGRRRGPRSLEAGGERGGAGGGGRTSSRLVIAEQLPTIPLVVRNSIWVSRPNVHGWLPHQYDIYPHYNDVWLSPQ